MTLPMAWLTALDACCLYHSSGGRAYMGTDTETGECVTDTCKQICNSFRAECLFKECVQKLLLNLLRSASNTRDSTVVTVTVLLYVYIRCHDYKTVLLHTKTAGWSALAAIVSACRCHLGSRPPQAFLQVFHLQCNLQGRRYGR